MFVFDCYGGGRYLDADGYRHRDKDAFLQLSNEVAVKLRVPLFLTRSDGTDYARAFYRRLLKASEALKASAQGALLVVAVDAADNSITAAQRMVPAEGSFVHKFVAFEHLPDNVRLLVTARSGRLDQLQLPNYFHKLEIAGLTVMRLLNMFRPSGPTLRNPGSTTFITIRTVIRGCSAMPLG
jgi:hypothetical protein